MDPWSVTMKSLNFPYNPQIDQLRWLAATLVFAFHFQLESANLGGITLTSAWWGLVTQGHTGVGLFFTLSGFLFMQIAFRNQGIAFTRFIRNRFLRIFPLFFTVFMVATSIGRDKFVPTDIFYLLSSNLGLAPTSYTVITGAAWCVSLEFLFYALFPFLSRFAIAEGPMYLIRLIALLVFFKLAAFSVNDKSDLMYFSTFVGRFDQFLIGMLAAFVFRAYEATLKKYAVQLLVLAFAIVVCNSAMQAAFAPFTGTGKSHFWIFWSLLESGGWAIFIVVWLANQNLLPARVAQWLCDGGKISFSFYLLHMGVIHLWAIGVGMITPTGSTLINTCVTAALVYAATWAISSMSYHTIELPFLRMRSSYGTQGSETRSASGN